MAKVSSGISVKVSLLGGEQENLEGTLSHSDFSTKNIFTPSLLSLPSHCPWVHKSAGALGLELPQEWDHTYVYAEPPELWSVCHSMGGGMEQRSVSAFWGFISSQCICD